MKFYIVLLALAVVVLSIVGFQCQEFSNTAEEDMNAIAMEKAQNLKKLVEIIEELESLTNIKTRYNEVRPKRPALFPTRGGRDKSQHRNYLEDLKNNQ